MRGELRCQEPFFGTRGKRFSMADWSEAINERKICGEADLRAEPFASGAGESKGGDTH
jgi:hypothetical protein